MLEKKFYLLEFFFQSINDQINQLIFRFSVRFWTKISAETEILNDTETEMHTETEISAETETEIFRSLIKINVIKVAM